MVGATRAVLSALWVALAAAAPAADVYVGGSASTTVCSAGVTVGKTLSGVRPFLKLGWFHASTDGSETSLIGPITNDESDEGEFGEARLRGFLGRRLAPRAGYERFDIELEDDGRGDALRGASLLGRPRMPAMAALRKPAVRR